MSVMPDTGWASGPAGVRTVTQPCTALVIRLLASSQRHNATATAGVFPRG
jgi:hypothetical protein